MGKQGRQRKAKRQKKLLTFILLISGIFAYNSCRNRTKLTRKGIVDPNQSAWRKLLKDGSDSDFLSITGFNRSAFKELVRYLFPFSKTKAKTGRPSSLRFQDKVGLYLVYCGSTLDLDYLCMLFGIVPSVCSNYLKEVRELICLQLKFNPHAIISFPNEQEMELYSQMIANRELNITNAIGFIDGVSIPCQCGEDEKSQRAYYNGYYKDTRCNNVFLFTPDGKIRSASINAPGSNHDTTVAITIMRRCLRKLKPLGKIVMVDKGFPRSGIFQDVLVGPLGKKTIRKFRRLLTVEQFEGKVSLHHTYTSLRQAAEWGMRGLQGSFPRLRTRLTSDSEVRKEIIFSICLLHNFRVSFVGISQIATVFGDENDKYINIDGYDKIARYYEVD